MAPDGMTRAGGAGATARPRARSEAGLSIVVPLFNEADNLAALHSRLVEVRGQNCRALGRQAHGRSAADTRSTSGHDSRLTLDFHISQFSTFRASGASAC